MDFNFIQDILKRIIAAIENSAVASVRAVNQTITSHLYRVEVINPQTKVEIAKGTVIVGNQKNLEEEVKKVKVVLDTIQKFLPELKEITVKNPTKIPEYPRFPNEMKVNNLGDIPATDLTSVVVAVGELQKIVAKLKFNPEIKVAAPVIPAPVVNIPEAKAPVVKVEATKVDLSALLELKTFFSKLIGNPKTPLPVQLSDGKKFYKALDEIVQAVSRSVSPFVTVDGDETRAKVNRRSELQVTSSETWDFNNQEEVSAALVYYGEENVDASWRIRRRTKSGKVITIGYAMLKNNPSVADYPAAWSDRQNLVYGRISEVL